MYREQARPSPTRALVARALLAALLVLVGLVGPRGDVVPANAAPSAAGDVGLLRSQLRADLEAYLQAHGAAEHVSAAALSVRCTGSSHTTLGGRHFRTSACPDVP